MSGSDPDSVRCDHGVYLWLRCDACDEPGPEWCRPHEWTPEGDGVEYCGRCNTTRNVPKPKIDDVLARLERLERTLARVNHQCVYTMLTDTSGWIDFSHARCVYCNRPYPRALVEP